MAEFWPNSFVNLETQKCSQFKIKWDTSRLSSFLLCLLHNTKKTLKMFLSIWKANFFQHCCRIFFRFLPNFVEKCRLFLIFCVPCHLLEALINWCHIDTTIQKKPIGQSRFHTLLLKSKPYFSQKPIVIYRALSLFKLS